MFSQVSTKMGRIKVIRKGKMAQRWMATALLDAEKRFRKIKGHLQIEEVKDRIQALQKQQAKAV